MTYLYKIFLINMMRYFAILMILILSRIGQIEAQITVGIEVGVSYMPYEIVLDDNTRASNKVIDPRIGISSNLAISESSYMQLRLGYIARREFDYEHYLFTQIPTGYDGFTYKSKIIEMSINYFKTIKNNHNLGMGLGLVRSIQSLIEYEYDFEPVKYEAFDTFFPMINISYEFKYKDLFFRLAYHKLLYQEIKYPSIVQCKEGRNDYGLTIGYILK